MSDGGTGVVDGVFGPDCRKLSRPALGPLFFAAVAGWLAAIAAEEACWRLSCAEDLPVPVFFAVAGSGAALCAFALLRRGPAAFRVRRLVRASAVSALSFLCVAACAGLCWSSLDADTDLLSRALSEGDVALEITTDAVQRDYGLVSSAEYAVGAKRIAARLTWPAGAEPASPGHVVLVSGRLLNSENIEARRWNHRNRYAGMVRAASVEDRGCAHSLRGVVAGFRDAAFERFAALGGDEGALLSGVVLGNRTLYAGSELEQAFRTTGLAHLMAVSGTHLAVVSALIGWLLARLPLRRRQRALVLCCTLALYAALTGFAPSALRSGVMCIAGLSGGVLGRRKDVQNALGLCVLAFIALDPPVAFSVGFLLSVLAVLGLTVFSSLCAAWLRCLLPARLQALCDPLSATVSATLLTVPVTVPLFVQFPLIAPLATLVAAPLVTFSLAAGLVGACVAQLVPAAATLALCCGAVSARACALSVRFLAALPGACVPLDAAAPLLAAAAVAAIVVLWAWWPDPSRTGGRARVRAALCAFTLPVCALLVSGLGGLFVAPSALPGFPSSAQVVMLDVGQGDAMLVRDANAAVLVDTGEKGDVLKRELAHNGVVHLDAIYITHKDADHCGALSALAGVVGVDHVFIHADLLGYSGVGKVLEAARWVTGGRGAEGVRPGARTRVGAFSITMLAPVDGGESENEDSLVNLLEYDADGDGAPEARGLLTGDAESDALGEVCPQVGGVDFVKVGHHGSAGAFSAEQLAVLRPKIALIGVGLNNKYGHPTAQTLGLLEQAGTQVFRTDLDGDVTVSFSKERIGVTVQKQR